jgi:hypothetical protein
MGHLINPVSTRLGFSTFWISSWSLVNLNMYSYFALLDNIIVELVSYFFYYSSSVDFLSKFGFFFSHFRLLRRGLNCFNIKVFFIPNTATAFSKTFVELENQERLNFAYLLGFKFFKLSSFVNEWIDRRLGQIKERRSLFRLRSPRFFQGETVLNLKERLLFHKSILSWGSKKRKNRVNWIGAMRAVCGNTVKFSVKRLQKGLPFSLFCEAKQKRQKKIAALSRSLNTRVGLPISLKGTLVGFCQQPIRASTKFLKFSHLRKTLGIKKQPKILLLSKLKLFKQRFLALVAFSRLRRTGLALSFFNYLSGLYSSFISESLCFLPSSYKPVKNPFRVSINFSSVNSFKLLNPQFIARFIAKRLSYGIPLRRVLQPIVTDLNKSIKKSSQLLSGFRIKCSGRFSRAQMASVTVERAGSLSISSMRNLVSMGYSTAFLRYGACGIKVWISSNDWNSCSSTIANNKLSVLKILNAVVLSFTKQGKRLFKPYFYNYLVSFFLVNLFLVDESTTSSVGGYAVEADSALSTNLSMNTNKQGALLSDEEFGLSDITLFSFLKFYHSFRRKRREQAILRFRQQGLARRQQRKRVYRNDSSLFQGKNKITVTKNHYREGFQKGFKSNKNIRFILNKNLKNTTINIQSNKKYSQSFFNVSGSKRKGFTNTKTPFFTTFPTTHLRE